MKVYPYFRKPATRLCRFSAFHSILWSRVVMLFVVVTFVSLAFVHHTYAAPSPVPPLNTFTFYQNPGTYNYVIPPGVTSITVEVWGGGGRGGSRTTGTDGTGGGGGGAYSRRTIAVTPGQIYVVNVGAGSTSNTAPGGDTWVSPNTVGNAFVLAKGGNSAASNVTTGATGGALTSGIGDFRFSGGNGANAPSTTSSGGGGSSAGTAANGTNASGTTGGIAPLNGGNGANGRTTAGSGTAGSLPGGGGSGAVRGTTGSPAGGAGAHGKVQINLTFDVNAGPDQTQCNNALFQVSTNPPVAGYSFSWSVVSGTGFIYDNWSTNTQITVPAGSSATVRLSVTDGTTTITDDVVLTNTTSCTPSCVNPININGDLEQQGTANAYNLSFQGTPASVIFQNSNPVGWAERYGTATPNTTSFTGAYYLNKTGVNGDPHSGSKFIYMAGEGICLSNLKTWQNMSCGKTYRVSVWIAAYSNSGTQSSSPFAIEFNGGGPNVPAFAIAETLRAPASASWNNLNWQRYSFEFTIPSTGYEWGDFLFTTFDNVNGIVIDDMCVEEVFNGAHANAGPDQFKCDNTFVMAANTPASGFTGSWSVVSGTASVSNVSSPTSPVTLTSGNAARLRWTVSKSGSNTFYAINPEKEGGFESCCSPYDNGWTAVNNGTNNWVVGTGGGSTGGSQAAYISNNGGTSAAYNITTAQTSHLYRDVTIHPDASGINLQFDWQNMGQSGFDRLLVYTAPTSVDPVAGVPASSSTTFTGATLVSSLNLHSRQHFSNELIALPSSLAGTTFRLIFTWQNNNSSGTNWLAGVIDNVTLSYTLTSCNAYDEMTIAATTGNSGLTVNNASICPGGSATLTATGCNSGNLLWNTGATSSSITVSPTSNMNYSVTCTPTVSTNILLNGNFESVTNLQGWTNWDNASITTNPADVYAGTKAVFLNGSVSYAGVAQGFDSTPGQRYRVRFYAKTTNSNALPLVRYHVYDNISNILDNGEGVHITSTNYQLYEFFIVTPPNTTWVTIFAETGDKGGLFVDNVEVVSVSGCTSTALATVTVGEVNLTQNPEFNSGITPWELYLNSGSATVNLDNTSQLSGTNSARINITTATGTNWHIQFAQPGLNLIAGKTYTLSFRARAASARVINASVDLGQDPWTNYFYQDVNLTTSSQLYTYTFTQPSTTTNARIVYNLGQSNQTVWIDDIQLKEVCSVEICNNGIDDNGNGLTDCSDPLCPCCNTITSGGIISGNQLECLNYNPGVITSTSGASGGSGSVVYQWEYSFDQISWEEIPGATGLTYDPGMIYQTTYYRRKAKNNTCVAWGPTSNVITKENTGFDNFQILTLQNTTFTGSTHVHGPMAVGGDMIINSTNGKVEVNMDNEGSYVFPGDGNVTTGLLIRGGVTFTNGYLGVLSNRFIHIGNSTNLASGDNGTNNNTQIYPSGTGYNNSQRIEGTVDQTPTPPVFQSVGYDFDALFSLYQNRSISLGAGTNNVQLFNSSNVAISGNNVSSPQSVKIMTLIDGFNYLNLSTTSLNNITEFNFEGSGKPTATKILIINVPVSANLTWNNPNMNGLQSLLNAPYLLWNFYGSGTNTLNINSNAMIYGTVFAPNQNLNKVGQGDMEGSIISRSLSIGTGQLHYYMFANFCDILSCAQPSAPIVGTITQPACSNPTGSVVLSGLPASGSWAITRSPGGTIYTGSGSSFTVTGLPANATYTFTVTNSSNCASLPSSNVVINASVAPPVLGGSTTVCIGSTSNVTPATNGTWTSSNTSVATITNAGLVNGLAAGTTTLTYTRTSDGCTNTVVFTVEDCTCLNETDNPEFNSGTTDWHFFASNGSSGTLNIDNTSQLSGTNSARINISAIAGSEWDMALYQDGQTIQSGKLYEISFMARASANRNILTVLTDFGNSWNSEYWEYFNLTTTPQTFKMYWFSDVNSNNFGFRFQTGASNPTVWIDNVVFKEVCPGPITNWNYSCSDNKNIEIIGRGRECQQNTSISLTNTSSITNVYVEAVYKTNNPGQTIIFRDANNNPYTAYRLPMDPGWQQVWVYRAVMPATSTVSYNDNTTHCSLQSVVVYAERNSGGSTQSNGYFTAVTGHNDIKTFNYTIPTATISRNITLKLPISELTNDGRYLKVTATAGSVSNTTFVYGPDPALGTCCLNIVQVTLNNVPGSVSQISVEVDTRNMQNGQSVNGQSYVLAGSVNAEAVCNCPSPPSPPTATGASRCGTGSVTLTASGCVGGTIHWYSALSGGSSLGTGTTFVTPSLSSTTTYYAACLLSGCESSRTAAVATINPLNPSITGNLNICNGNSTTLTASGGGTYLWSTGATSAAITVSPMSNSSYVVTVTNGSCSGTASATVNITPTCCEGPATSNVIAKYNFAEGTGSVVNDVSGFGSPLNLTIQNPANTTWVTGCGLRINSSTRIASTGNATKIRTALQATNAMTVEAWVQAANATQNGPARIVSMSTNTSERNFTLGQGTSGGPGTVWAFRTRQSGTNDWNGNPERTTTANSVTTNLTHLVFTRDAAGVERFYINGVQNGTWTQTGNFSNWSDYVLNLGNEQSNDRPWLGTLYGVTIYSGALNATQVTQNFNAGSKGDCSNCPPPDCTTQICAPLSCPSGNCYTNNLIVNPDFETNVNNWIASNGQVSQGGGGRYGNFIQVNVSDLAGTYTAYQDVNFGAGQPYRFEGNVAKHGVNNNVKVYLEFYNGSTYLSKTADFNVTMNYDGWNWENFGFQGVTPANTTKIRIVAWCNGNAIKMDKVSLIGCTSITSTANANNVCVGGTINLTSSINLNNANPVRQLVSNGDFVSGSVNGFSTDVPSGSFGFTTNPQFANGSWVWGTDNTTGSGNMMWFSDDNAASNRRQWFNTYTVVPNTTYTLSFWVRNVWSGGSNPTLFWTVNGTQVGSTISPAFGSNWVQLSTTWNSGSNTSATFAVVLQTNSWSFDFALDDISITGTETSYQWSGPNSYSSSSQNNNLTNAISSMAGTYNVITSAGNGCTSSSNVNVVVSPTNTVTSGATRTLCINTALSPAITHTTTGATGIGTVTGLPAGVTAAWASNTITISGTPSASGTFNYTIPLTGGCGAVNATGTITVTANNTLTTNATRTLCINTALSPTITHTTTGATGIGAATGLPAGVTATWASNTITISGTPTASGTFNYTIPLTGGCGTVNATGQIIVTSNRTVTSNAARTLCINSALSPAITHTTTGATGIGTATGLPAGVTATWASNTITISGTPTASGTFNYTIPLTGGCGNINATGTITVTANNTVTTNASRTLCINTALSPTITHTTTGATGIGTATGLPSGVTASWASNSITISGTPTASGTFNYTIPLTGGCGTVNATGTIVVTANNTVTGPGSATTCINTAITNITHTTTGATGIGTASGLPAGVTAVWSSNTITIGGTPTASGTFNYTIPLTGGCGNINATGSITVNAVPLLGGATSVCIGSTANVTPATAGTWTSSNNAIATITNGGVVTGVTSGTVTLTYTRTSDGCSNTTNFVVNSLPVANITGDNYICTGLSTTLTAAGGTTYVWQTGQNTSAITVSPTVATTYIVTVTNGNGCTNTASYLVQLYPAFTVNATSPTQNICAGHDLVLNGSMTNGVLRETYTGISGTLVSNLTSHSSYPSSPNVREFRTNTIGPSGVGENYGTRVRYYFTPQVSGDHQFVIYGDDETILYWSGSDATSPLSMLANVPGWTNEGELTRFASQTSALVNLTAGQQYYFELLHKEGGGGDHYGILYKLAADPGFINIPESTLSPIKISWTGPNSYTSSNVNNVISNTTTSHSGVYSLTGTDFFGCQVTSNVNVTVNANPTVPVVGTITQPTCTTPTGSVVLSGLPATGSWTITRTPGGITYNGTGTSFTVTGLPVSTTYTFTVTNSNTCTSPTSANVTINAIPSNPTLGGASAVCVGSTANVTPATGGTWASSNTLVATITNAGLVTGVSAGSVTLTYTRTIDGCSNTRPFTVNANPTVLVVGTITQPTCTTPTGSVVLSGLPSTGSWTITRTPGGTTYTGTGTSFTVTGLPVSTTYTFTVTNSNTCTSPASANVAINAIPGAPTLGGASAVCVGSTANVTPSTGGTWASSNTLVATITNAGLITGVAAGSVTLTYTRTSDGCSNTRPFTVNTNPTAPVVGTITQPTCTTPTGSVVLSGLPAAGSWTITRTTGGTTYTGTGTSFTVTGLPVSTTYTFTVTNSNTCTSPASANVTINAIPGAPTLGGASAVCVGSTANVTPATGGTWISSNTSLATITNAGLVTGVAAGSVTLTYTRTIDGCSNALPFTVNANPTAPVVGTITQPTCTTPTGSVVLSGLPSTGSWTITRTPDGTTYTGTGTSFTVTGLPVSTTYTFTVTNSNACTSAASANVAINAIPGAPTLGGASAVCVGSTTNVTPATGGTWTSSNTSIASITNAGLVTGVAAGSVTLTYTRTSDGCSNTLPFTVNSNPTAPVVGTITQPTCTTPTGSVVLSGLPATGSWTITRSPGGTTYIGTGVSFIVTGLPVSTTYTFTVTNSNGCTSPASANVAINAIPGAPALGGASAVCIGSTANVTPATGGTWASSNTSIASITNAGVVTGVAAGSVTLTYTRTSDGCSNTRPFTVNTNPTAPVVGTITQPTCTTPTGSVVLSGLPATGSWTITRTPGGVTYNGSGSTFTVTNLSPDNNFTFILTNVNGCSSPSSNVVNINSIPSIPTLGGDNMVCVGGTANVTPSTSGTWSSSNTSIANITNTGLITGIAPGMVILTYTRSSNGCSGTREFTVYAIPNTPVVGAITQPNCAVPTGSVILNGLPATGNYTINQSPGGISYNASGSSFTINGLSPNTNYTFTVTSAQNCTSPASTSVNITGIPSSPSVSIDYNGSVCLEDNKELSAIVTGGIAPFTYLWNGPSGFTASTQTVVIATNGNYYLTVTDANLCKAVTSGFVYERYEPFVVSLQTRVCEGQNVTLDVNSPSAVSYLWGSNAGNGTTKMVTVTPQVPSSTYLVTVTNDLGCTAVPEITIEVDPRPIVSISGSNIICQEQTTQLSPSTGGTWVSTNPGVATINNSGLVTGVSAGTATFVFTSSTTNCASHPSAPVTVHAKPVVVVTGPNPICIGQTTTLSPSTGGTWTSSNVSVATVNNSGIVTGISTGTATFTYTNTSTSCVSNASSAVSVQNLPSATITG
jgi:hypothetical protein